MSTNLQTLHLAGKDFVILELREYERLVANYRKKRCRVPIIRATREHRAGCEMLEKKGSRILAFVFPKLKYLTPLYRRRVNVIDKSVNIRED